MPQKFTKHDGLGGGSTKATATETDLSGSLPLDMLIVRVGVAKEGLQPHTS
jgi:hypothetical protein